MFLTEAAVSRRLAHCTPKVSDRGLVRTILIFMKSYETPNLLHVSFSDEVDPLMLAGDLNKTFSKAAINNAALVLHILPLASSIRAKSYLDVIKAFEEELASTTRADTEVFFILDEVKQALEEFKFETGLILTYLGSKTDIKSVIVTSPEDLDRFMHVHNCDFKGVDKNG